MAASYPSARDLASGVRRGEFDAKAAGHVGLPVERITEILTDAREQAAHDLAELTGNYEDLVAAAQLSNADDEHDAEGATIASERSQLDALVRAAQERLTEIEAARARLAEGRYGVCEDCGRPIAAARLEARPIARVCIECAGRGPA
jgi:RNA polymerase-binding transcription factor DksA